MEILTEQIIRHGQEFLLTNQRVVFWTNENALLLADLHLGKSTFFRQHGIPISKEVAEQDLFRLGQVITHFNPEKVIIIGDFFHAHQNDELLLFQQFQDNFSVQWQLIRGNHDFLNSSIYHNLGFEVFQDACFIESIGLIHEPKELCEYFVLSGHIHPGVLLKMNQKQKIKLPCYLISNEQLVLPAFSEFTGLDTNYNKNKQFETLAFNKNLLMYV